MKQQFLLVFLCLAVFMAQSVNASCSWGDDSSFKCLVQKDGCTWNPTKSSSRCCQTGNWFCSKSDDVCFGQGSSSCDNNYYTLPLEGFNQTRPYYKNMTDKAACYAAGGYDIQMWSKISPSYSFCYYCPDGMSIQPCDGKDCYKCERRQCQRTANPDIIAKVKFPINIKDGITNFCSIDDNFNYQNYKMCKKDSTHGENCLFHDDLDKETTCAAGNINSFSCLFERDGCTWNPNNQTGQGKCCDEHEETCQPDKQNCFKGQDSSSSTCDNNYYTLPLEGFNQTQPYFKNMTDKHACYAAGGGWGNTGNCMYCPDGTTYTLAYGQTICYRTKCQRTANPYIIAKVQPYKKENGISYYCKDSAIYVKDGIWMCGFEGNGEICNNYDPKWDENRDSTTMLVQKFQSDQVSFLGVESQ